MNRLRRVARGKPGALRHSRTPEHLKGCRECTAALHRERQYLERLRQASVPEASQDLAARLIRHTRELAEEPLPSGHGGWARGRVVAVSVGALALSAGVLAVAAYSMAGDPMPRSTEEPGAGQAVEQRAAAALAGAALDGKDGSPANGLTSGLMAGRTMELDTAGLRQLRREGWACPELAGMGFHVVSAQASMEGGHPSVILRLENGPYHAVVHEQHFSGLGNPRNAELSLTYGTLWSAVYRTGTAMVSYSSDLPPARADDAVPELVQAVESADTGQAGQAAENWFERMLRGFRTLARPAGL